MSRERTFLYLNRRDVGRCVTMSRMIGAMKEAFVQISDRTASIPQRTRIDVDESDGVALFMPGYAAATGMMGVKTVTLFRGNRSKGIPTIHGMILVLSAESGEPLAIMDGEHITAMRTGAASGVATELLARGDARTVSVIGSGVQAETQLEAVCCVRNIRTAYVLGRDKEKASRFAERMCRKLGIQVRASANDEVLSDSDILCTATSATTPVFDPARIGGGTHINAIGSYKADRCELPAETVAMSRIYVDSLSAALVEAGDIIIPMRQGKIAQSDIRGEIGGVLLGRVEGRESDEEITLFKSVGNAAQDLVAAGMVLRTAEQMNIGVRIGL